MTRIDLIDVRGNVREHVLRPDGKTLCGRKVGLNQQSCGNARCKQCEQLAQRKGLKVEDGNRYETRGLM